MSGPGPYGPGPRSDPHDQPYGPDVSWPNGFRRLDTESRRLLESGYRPGQYDHVDPRYGTSPGRRGYQQPAMDDYGYGDPGYSDPSYDGPRNQFTGPMFALGNQGPRPQGGSGAGSGSGAGPGPAAADGYGPRPGYTVPPAGPQGMYRPGDVYPVTGAQQALPATGPQPAAGYWPGQGPAQTDASSRAYRDQRYDTPRSGVRVPDGLRREDPRFDAGRPRLDEPRPGGPRHAGGGTSDAPGLGGGGTSGGPGLGGGGTSGGPGLGGGGTSGGPGLGGGHATDPRLEGIRYDELRYDEPAYDDEPAYGGSRYDQPLDDVSWYEELRRSAPAYPERPGGPGGSGGSGSGGSGGSGGQPASGKRPADAPRHGDPRVPSHGQQPGYQPLPTRKQPSGYGQGRDDRGGPGLSMRAGREMGTGPQPGPGPQPGEGPGPRVGAGPGRQTAPPASQPLAFQELSFREAPTLQVGVLTPPRGGRVYNPQEDTTTFMAAPTATQFLTPAVRPGHGLDGPEITGSWPAQPQADDVDSFEDFWREDDEDEEYRGLFADEEDDLGDQHAATRRSAGRRSGRRRGRSSDHRLWLALLGVVIAAAAAITAIIKFEFPSHSGPVHVMQIPPKVGTFQRTVNMERTTHLAELRAEVIQMSAGQASAVKSAVYESGNSAAGSTTQIVMFIGGHLANAAPATSITDFTQKFAGATVVSAGSLGGKAACVQVGAAGTPSSVAMCVWFDNDSFGEIVSPTMNATTLANVMRTVRPDLEIVVKN